jgi:dTDP-4-dehydrorhamnose 3,5-epimerase
MHFQAAPHAEAKLVRCTAGMVYDVVLDLRRESPAYRRWHALELRPRNLRMLYIPEGCAHGFMTLTDSAEVFYQLSAPHVPEAARGVRWNDPAFSIDWPGEPLVVAKRDAQWPLWREPQS